MLIKAPSPEIPHLVIELKILSLGARVQLYRMNTQNLWRTGICNRKTIYIYMYTGNLKLCNTLQLVQM